MLRFYIALIFCVGISCNEVEAQNVASGKSYRLSEEPNYALTKGNDQSDLTDGVKKSGTRFWQDKSTVGWRSKDRVIIDLDLEGNYDLKQVNINTARNEVSGVSYPRNVFLFTSSDDENFTYQGDIMLTSRNEPGEYKVEEFALIKPIPGARYIKLVLISDSKFFFLDEIEVLGSDAKSSLFSKNNESQTVKSSELNTAIKTIQAESNRIRNKYNELTSLKGFLNEESIPELNNMSIDEIQKLISEEERRKLEVQKENIPAEIIINRIAGIDKLKSFNLSDVLKSEMSNPSKNIESGSQILLFSVLNNLSDTQVINLDVGGSLQMEVYEILKVASFGRNNLFDALKNIENGNVSLNAGEQKFIAVRINANNQTGPQSGKLTMNSSKGNLASIQLNIKPLENVLPEDKLNINVWAYLDKPVLQNNKQWVINDLEQNEVNVAVVHSAFIDAYGTGEFKKLKSYLSQLKNLENKKILLFYNFRSREADRFKGKTFLDQTWQNNFKDWYVRLQTELKNIGIPPDHIYFYPYDEITVSEVENFINLNKWAKSAIPGFQSFVTIIDEKTFGVAKYADIVQLSSFMIDKAAKISNNNLWFYDVLDNSRLRDPYKDYRLMAWKAYYHDLKGVGFWNYSTIPLENAKYDKPVQDLKEDFSVLYTENDNSPIISLRWLYFQKGIEDYKILKLAEKSMGKDKVRKLVKEVIDSPQNTNMADVILSRINN